MAGTARPTLAVWKFASCDGCQLTLLDCEDELLAVAGAVDIAYFLEAGRAGGSGPFDLSLVEGSVTTPDDIERIRQVRAVSRHLVTIGACATAGGVQALRNFADVEEYLSIVYAQPEFITTLADSTPIAAHVPVDFELRGCPIDKRQLVEVLAAFLHGRRPEVPGHSVCVECKLRGNICVMVAHGTPCLGPVTHAGLRGAVPHVPPGLLRVLRPDGDAEHRRPGRRAGGRRRWRDRSRAAAADVQQLVASRSERRAKRGSRRHRPRSASRSASPASARRREGMSG